MEGNEEPSAGEDSPIITIAKGEKDKQVTPPEEEPLVKEVEHAAVFDAGFFTIQNISGDGFRIESQHKRRRDPDSKFPLTEDESARLKDLMRGDEDELPKGKYEGEIGFAQNKAKKQAKKEGREPTPIDYVNNMAPKVGIRNIVQRIVDGEDVLSFDTRPVTYPVYSDLVDRETSDPLLLDFGEITGTAAAIFTTDGKLILQYRGKGNRAYGNVPGASAAGLLDGEFNREPGVKRGTLKDIDPTAALRKEISEELDVDDALVDSRILAVAHDEVKPHHEFILSATIPHTSQELAKKGLIPDEVEGRDFKERYFTIDGTPEAIKTLLTEVKCPLPSTHAAAFFIAGFQKKFEQSGKNAAYEWARETSQKIKMNAEAIDKTVRERYEEFPAQLGDKPPRSKKGYDPLYFPEQQGLPPLLDELKRTGLISQEMYKVMKAKYTPEEHQGED